MARFNFSQYRRRSVIPLAGLALAAYYVFVFLPLDRRAARLDAPLQKAWQKLANSLEQTNALALDFLHITNQLRETHQALAALEQAKQKATARFELAPVLRARMTAAFQLVEYQNERSKQVDELTKLAKQQQATIEPAVFAGFPEHTADTKQPSLLWAALSFINSFLTTALQCKVIAIHTLEAQGPFTNAPPEVAGRLAEIPVQVELTGNAPSVGKLLEFLPLRAEEAHALGLPDAPNDKAPLLLEHLVIKKQSPDKPDEIRILVRVVGFVFRE